MKKTILLQEIAKDLSRPDAERQLAEDALSDEPSEVVQRFLTERGKTHLREISEPELLAYIDSHDLRHQRPLESEELIREFGMWHLPAAKILECLGFSKIQYWLLVIDQTKSNAVKINALQQLRALKEEA
jgi:hypothetical protein